MEQPGPQQLPCRCPARSEWIGEGSLGAGSQVRPGEEERAWPGGLPGVGNWGVVVLKDASKGISPGWRPSGARRWNPAWLSLGLGLGKKPGIQPRLWPPALPGQPGSVEPRLSFGTARLWGSEQRPASGLRLEASSQSHGLLCTDSSLCWRTPARPARMEEGQPDKRNKVTISRLKVTS